MESQRQRGRPKKEGPVSVATQKKREYRERQRCQSQKRQRGRPKKEGPVSVATQKKREYRERQRCQQQQQQETMSGTMKYLAEMAGLTTPKKTAVEEVQETISSLLKTKVEDRQKQQSLHEKAEERRLLEARAACQQAEAANKQAEAARLREETARLEQLERQASNKEVMKLVKIYEAHTPNGKKRAADTKAMEVDVEEVIEANETKAVAHPKAVAQPTPTPKKKRVKSKSTTRQPGIKEMDSKTLLDYLTVEKVQALDDFPQVKELLEACYNANLFNDAMNKRKRNKLGPAVLRAICNAIDEYGEIELNYEELESHKMAQLILDYLFGRLG